ncbi:MAG: hypothetical protein J6X44_10250, partial [Thermoguttaceae bacterium]|nr:hypothetical protein [Thermoguttaceae bacterium]
MDSSSELLEAARNAYESEYAEWHNRQEFRPVDVKLFKYLLERVTDETEGWAFEDYDRLLRVVNAKYQGIKPDLRGLEPGARSGDYGDYSDEPFDSSENDFPGYDYMSKEPSDEVVEETVRATAKADRREALQAINEILEKYYPHKTIFAATDFDKIRERFAARAPRLGRDISDLDLKSLIFSVGATLIGELKPREERLGASRSVSEPYRQGPF